MPRPRVVSAKNRPFKHVVLSDDDWINLKQKLNYGEASQLYDATYRSSVGGAQDNTAREVRMSEFNLQRIMLYTLEWSFVDDEMKPLALNAANVGRLDPDTANEIHDAITAIEEENNRVSREQDSSKNGPAAEVKSPVSTSGSTD